NWRAQSPPTGFAEKTTMEISGHKTAAVFRRYDIVDEQDLVAVAAALDRKHQTQLSHNSLVSEKQPNGGDASKHLRFNELWALQDLNLGPMDYESVFRRCTI